MTKGGYQIINFENRELVEGSGSIFEGVYDKIKSTRKCILLSGINLDGYELHNTFATPEIFGSAYRFVLLVGATEYSLIIDDNNVVTYNSI